MIYIGRRRAKKVTPPALLSNVILYFLASRGQSWRWSYIREIREFDVARVRLGVSALYISAYLTHAIKDDRLELESSTGRMQLAQKSSFKVVVYPFSTT
jgi:hypothetical protein